MRFFLFSNDSVMMQEQKSAAIAARYAGALFALTQAQPANAQTQLRALVENLIGWIKEHDALAALVQRPSFSRKEQEAGLLAVARKAGAPGLLQNFLRLVCRKGRLFLLPQMLAHWQARCAAAAGEERISVQTACALSADEIARLQKMLARPGAALPHLEVQLVPELLGGVIVQRGSQLMDASVRGQLQRAAHKMKEAGDGY